MADPFGPEGDDALGGLEPAGRRSMVDPLSMGAGAVLFGLALTVLVGGGGDLLDNAGWVLPLALIVVGLLGGLPARRLRRR
jgi:hypothetical protein